MNSQVRSSRIVVSPANIHKGAPARARTVSTQTLHTHIYKCQLQPMLPMIPQTILLQLVLGVVAAQHPCQPSPCGTNTRCDVSAKRAVCSCLPGHFGNPIIACIKGECTVHEDCPAHRACTNNNCVDPCLNRCGTGARCTVARHVPTCSCPPGYRGDPFTICRRMDPEDLCRPSPCGPNTNCKVTNYRAICSCLSGYKGSPLQGCVPECQSDYECQNDEACHNNHCHKVCSDGSCGRNALCQSHNHRALCSCPQGNIGDPLVECRAECYTHSECPHGKPSCLNGHCSNPCDHACGVNADCRVKGNVAICSCPKHMTGHPMHFCRPFTKDDLCNPNPCGTNAVCHPGKDNTGNDRPICTCLPGYVGNALHQCLQGECQYDNDCPKDRYCDENTHECANPCRVPCGVGTTCTVRNHYAVCSCLPGYTGDATFSCSPSSSNWGLQHFSFGRK